MILNVLVFLLVAFAAAVAFYYFLLAVVAFWNRTPNAETVDNDKKIWLKFAVLVPAHNEEKSISSTIESCLSLDYPWDKFQVFAIADNCTDDTASIARKMGATVLERHDPVHRGKGFALKWALDQLMKKDFDAFLVIDADCVVDVSTLRRFNYHLQQGVEVLQANDVTLNPDESVMSYALAVGNIIENDLFYVPKSKLKLAVFLRGTGMVFHRQVFEKFPWNAHSIVEDADYTLTLLRNGVVIKFVPEVKVASPFPASQNQLVVQRKRWAQGTIKFSKLYGFKIIWQGIKARNLLMIDGGWTLLVLSKPLVLLELGISLFLAIVNVKINPGNFSSFLLFFAIAAFLLQVVYFVTGISLLGLNSRRIRFLLHSPNVFIRLIFIAMGALFKNVQTIWTKTPR